LKVTILHVMFVAFLYTISKLSLFPTFSSTNILYKL